MGLQPYTPNFFDDNYVVPTAEEEDIMTTENDVGDIILDINALE